MERSDAIHVTVAGIFLGVGGVGLTILIPLAAAVKPHDWTAAWFLIPTCCMGALAVAGLYMIGAVYRGWPMPETASERVFAPDLRAIEAHVTKVDGDGVLIRIALRNYGRGNINDALVNVVLPAFFTSIRRCAEDGGLGHHQGAWSTTSENLGTGRLQTSIYWNGNVSFPGRMSRIIFFRAPLSDPSVRTFPLRLEVTAVELERALDQRFTIMIPEDVRVTAS
jgi:hypothetical protein